MEPIFIDPSTDDLPIAAVSNRENLHNQLLFPVSERLKKILEHLCLFLRWFKNWRNTLFWQFLTEPPCCSNVKISRRCRNSFPVERAGDAPLRRVRLKLCAFFRLNGPTALVLQLIKSPWILTIPLDKIQSSWTTYINFLTCTYMYCNVLYLYLYLNQYIV